MLSRTLTQSLVAVTALVSTNLYAATCDFKIANEWNSGFTSKITITNDTDELIDGWNLSIAFPNDTFITGMWRASLSGSNPYTAVNKGWNAKIQPNNSVTIGFNSQKPINGEPAVVPTLGGICLNADSNNRPIADASVTPLEGTVPLTVNLDASGSSDPDGDDLTYSWSFDDGTTASGEAISRTFEDAGIYSVTLTANDGQVDSLSTTYSIKALAPEPEEAVCQLSVMEEWISGYRASVRVSNTEDVAITDWDVTLAFSDSTSITGVWNGIRSGNNPYTVTSENYNRTIWPNSSIEFGFNAEKGTHGESPVIPALGGICGTLIVNHPPVAEVVASPLSGFAPLEVNFDASNSTDPDGDELTYFWNFGNGDTSIEFLETRTFSEPGTYTVSLTVLDPSLVSSSVDVIITVQEYVPPNSYALDASLSSLYFISTKKIHTIESHTFTDISGDITAEGAAKVVLNLDSVDTGIDTRDGRMRDYLFETATFSQAEITLDVDMDVVETLAVGSSIDQVISPLVNLHGHTVSVEAQVRISRLDDDSILVQSTNPILIQAADFDLVDGIEVLRGLANLSVISYTVPTNFTLVFNTQ